MNSIYLEEFIKSIEDIKNYMDGSFGVKPFTISFISNNICMFFGGEFSFSMWKKSLEKEEKKSEKMELNR